jgi:hypothetical protein
LELIRAKFPLQSRAPVAMTDMFEDGQEVYDLIRKKLQTLE